MRYAVQDADGAVDAALFDLDQHPTRDTTALGETVEGEIGRLSRLRYGVTERRKVHGRRRLDHKSSGNSPRELLSVQDNALNMATCHPRVLLPYRLAR